VHTQPTQEDQTGYEHEHDHERPIASLDWQAITEVIVGASEHLLQRGLQLAAHFAKDDAEDLAAVGRVTRYVLARRYGAPVRPVALGDILTVIALLIAGDADETPLQAPSAPQGVHYWDFPATRPHVVRAAYPFVTGLPPAALASMIARVIGRA
jgi:hypothetical protein